MKNIRYNLFSEDKNGIIAFQGFAKYEEAINTFEKVENCRGIVRCDLFKITNGKGIEIIRYKK